MPYQTESVVSNKKTAPYEMLHFYNFRIEIIKTRKALRDKTIFIVFIEVAYEKNTEPVRFYGFR